MPEVVGPIPRVAPRLLQKQELLREWPFPSEVFVFKIGVVPRLLKIGVNKRPLQGVMQP